MKMIKHLALIFACGFFGAAATDENVPRTMSNVAKNCSKDFPVQYYFREKQWEDKQTAFKICILDLVKLERSINTNKTGQHETGVFEEYNHGFCSSHQNNHENWFRCMGKLFHRICESSAMISATPLENCVIKLLIEKHCFMKNHTESYGLHNCLQSVFQVEKQRNVSTLVTYVASLAFTLFIVGLWIVEKTFCNQKVHKSSDVQAGIPKVKAETKSVNGAKVANNLSQKKVTSKTSSITTLTKPDNSKGKSISGTPSTASLDDDQSKSESISKSIVSQVTQD